MKIERETVRRRTGIRSELKLQRSSCELDWTSELSHLMDAHGVAAELNGIAS